MFNPVIIAQACLWLSRGRTLSEYGEATGVVWMGTITGWLDGVSG